MAVSGSINVPPDVTRRRRTYFIALTFSGSYANSGTSGDLLDFTALTNVAKVERPFPHRVPKSASNLQVLNEPPGYTLVLELGTVITGAVGVRVFQSGASGNPYAELSNGAYPAGLVASTEGLIAITEEN